MNLDWWHAQANTKNIHVFILTGAVCTVYAEEVIITICITTETVQKYSTNCNSTIEEATYCRQIAVFLFYFS